MAKVILSPSILSIENDSIPKALEDLKENIVDWVHFDVMDGKFVPQTSFGVEKLKEIRPLTYLFIDTHLMCNNVLDILNDYIEAGADLITFHYEAVKENDIPEIIRLIKRADIKVGIALKPETDVSKVFPYLRQLDVCLIMSVEPGKGGQTFNETALEKIEKLKHEIDTNHYNCYIEVDGGINDVTGKKCIEKGAKILVSGTYVFSGDIKEKLESLRGENV